MEEIKRDNVNADNFNNASQAQQGLTFKDILFIIRKHWIAIVIFIIAGIAGGAVWAGVESRVFPAYKSTGTIMVYYKGSENTAVTTEYSFSNSITNTVVGFIKTNTVLDQVAEEVNIPRRTISSNLTVTNSTGNLLITVSYTSSDAEEAKKVTNAIMEIAIREGNLKNAESEAVYPMLDGNLSIIDHAEKGSKVSHTVRNLAIGLGAGVVLAFGYVVIRELSDNTFKSAEEIERTLNIPVLAGIPDYHFDDEKKGGK